MSVIPFSALEDKINNIQLDQRDVPSIPAISHFPVLTGNLSRHMIFSLFLLLVALQLLWTVIILVASTMLHMKVSNLGRYGIVGGWGDACLSGHDTDNEGSNYGSRFLQVVG